MFASLPRLSSEMISLFTLQGRSGNEITSIRQITYQDVQHSFPTDDWYVSVQSPLAELLLLQLAADLED